MFSNNRKISIRQAKRLMILDLFGISSLLLPGLLAKTAGTDGIFCIAAAGLLAFGYLWLLEKVINQMDGDYYGYLKRVTGNFPADILMIFYLFFFLLLSAFGLYQLTGLIRAWLLPEGSYGWICFLLLAVAAYAAIRGMEVRARIYEMLFWILGIPLLVMLILAARGVDVNYWTPVAVSSFSGFSAGTMSVFAFFLPLFFIQFLKPYCARPERLSGGARWAVGITAALNGIIYLILIGTFQVKTTEVLKRPIITLMSMVKLPGEFLARLDAFMTAIWFFSLFALINTGVFYSGHVLKALFREKKTSYGLLVVLVLEFGGARWFYVYPQAEEVFMTYIRYIAMPVLVILPVLLLILGKHKARKVAGLLSMTVVLLLNGCSARELEDKGFPMAIGIDKDEENIVLTFDFPDLSESEKGESPSQRPLSFSVEGGAYYESQKAYENNTNKVLDYSHLKAIVISQEFLADNEELRELLAWLEQEEVLARNTCLFVAQDRASNILALTGQTSGTMGKYLEQMVDTQEDFKANKVVTIGDLMNQWHNQNEVLLIPVLINNGGVPSITKYAAMDAFVYKGTVSVEESMKAFLCQGLLSRFLYQLQGGTVFQLTNLKPEIKILGNSQAGDSQVGDSQITVQVALSGEARMQKAGRDEAQTKGMQKKQLDQQLEETLAVAADQMKDAPGIDLTNSFILLGGYARGLYDRYQQDPVGYEKSLNYRFLVDMDIVNE